LVTLSSGSIRAAGIAPLGTVLGIFSNPVLTGLVGNNPAPGQFTFVDNSLTASDVIQNSTDPGLIGSPPEQVTGSSLAWGTSTPPTLIGLSQLFFFGGQVPADIHQQFQVGTFTFLNGTSDQPSLIFGATISFYDNVVSNSTFLGSDTIAINTTTNLGQNINQDSDYLNICGNNSFICLTSINAIEEGEGGFGVTVNLFGNIVGDPTLFLNRVALAPGQSATTNGYLGTDQAFAPEPGTLVTLPIALVLCIGFARRKASSKR
jgi:hypothetical protein